MQRALPADVYNIEVDCHHVYEVGEVGVLVHNAYGDARPRGLFHKPLKSGDVDQYRYFRNRPHDGLAGHEIWQNASTNAYGLGGRTGFYGSRNPAMALSNRDHDVVNALQKIRIPNASSMNAIDNIRANISVLREAQKLHGINVSDAQIANAARRAIHFFLSLQSSGII